MPSILFHELVSYKFTQRNPKYNTANFYLGTIVPDAVNAYGFATKEKRWKAHQRDKNLEKWKTNIIKFYKENLENQEKTYLMGYLIHVLTDIFCDESYQERLYPELLKKGYDYNSAYEYYEDSIKKIENHNINEIWWNNVKEQIQKGDKNLINGIDETMIKDWISYTLEKYKKRTYEEEDYITIEFVDEIVNKIQELLNKKRIFT